MDVQIHKRNDWRYAILEHTVQNQVHWDFLFEREMGGPLLTWSFSSPPWELDTAEVIRLPDHRAIYLEYEGEIAPQADDPLQRSRGSVRRVRSGFFVPLLPAWDPPRGACVDVSQLDEPADGEESLRHDQFAIRTGDGFGRDEIAAECHRVDYMAANKREYRFRLVFWASNDTVVLGGIVPNCKAETGEKMGAEEWMYDVRFTLLDAATSRWTYRRIHES